ncbi:MAG: hypothetical protein R2932_17920 [Caldilineaceae bacterium]
MWAVELAANGQTGLGKDHNGDGKGDGFNIPSLWPSAICPRYYHNGACETLVRVLERQHPPPSWSAHLGQNDFLASTANQAKVITFLQSLDAETDFPLNLYVDPHDIFSDPAKPFKDAAVVGANISLFGTKADLKNLLQDLGVASIGVDCRVISAWPRLQPVPDRR